MEKREEKIGIKGRLIILPNKLYLQTIDQYFEIDCILIPLAQSNIFIYFIPFLFLKNILKNIK